MNALLEELRLGVLVDEIQNAPELFGYIRTRIDRNPRRMGQWLFSASQEAPSMQGVTESMPARLWSVECRASRTVTPRCRLRTVFIGLLLMSWFASKGHPMRLVQHTARCFGYCFVLCTFLFMASPGYAQPSGGPYARIDQRYEVPKAAHVDYVAPDGKADSPGTTLEQPATRSSCAGVSTARAA